MIDQFAKLKHERLRHMQRLATALLLVMLVLLAVSASLTSDYPWLHWVQAFAAAATVGAIADWFAVVALFHHPLGLPFPHTAIVPANKDRIGASLGQFVEHNFLTPENVTRELEGRNLILAVADWMVKPTNADAVSQRLCSLIPSALVTMADKDFKPFFDRVVPALLNKLEMSRAAAEILTILTANGRHEDLLIRTLQGIEAWLLKNHQLIRAKFSATSKFTPGVVASYIVNKFVNGIITLLHDAASDSSHPIRQQFDAFTLDFIDKLKHSPEYAKQLEALSQEFMLHLEREDYYTVVWNDVKQRILDDLEDDHSLLRIHVTDALIRVSVGLRADAVVQTKLNAWGVHAIETLVRRHAHQVSNLIAEVVRRWDPHELAEKLELEIGKDLQYIRINGTLVGGLVGLLLHAITYVG